MFDWYQLMKLGEVLASIIDHEVYELCEELADRADSPESDLRQGGLIPHKALACRQDISLLHLTRLPEHWLV